MIKALVFDFDGLIIDTETPSYEAFFEIYRGYGVELPLKTYAQCIGTTFEAFNPYSYLSECLEKEIDTDLVRNQFRTEYRNRLECQTLRPGVTDYLEAATQLNLKIGLASSSSLSWIQPYLERHNLAAYFSSICTSDHVAKVKPDPELYMQSLDNLGVSGEEAIAFEDSLNGLKAAKSAGLHCVIVPNEVTRYSPFCEHNLMINSMSDLPLEQVIRAIG